MAGRSKFSSEDKARAFAVLSVNDGNVKRTARETGVPESTVRRWRDEWLQEPPPAAEVEEAVAGWLDRATSVRDLALERIEEKLNGPADKVKLSELNVTVGVLTDKIDRARGVGEASRVDHHHHLPSGEELRELMAGFVQNMAESAAMRDAEIVEAEIVEQAALPSGR